MVRWRWAGGLLWALAGWVLGAALQLQQSALWPLAVYLVLAALALLGACWTLASVRSSPRWLGMWAVGLGLAWSGLLACNRAPPLPAALEGQDLDLVGVVAAMPQVQAIGTRFVFRIEQARHQGQPVVLPERIQLGWYPPRGDAFAHAQAMMPAQRLPEAAAPLGEGGGLQAGERWRFRVRLKAPHGHLNPRGFDLELWLWERGLGATGHVRQGALDPPPQRLGQTLTHPVEWVRQKVRQRLLAHLDPAKPGPQVAGILAALVTGDQAAIERSDWEVFRATGVSHLMSISGVHVTMLGWLVAALVGRAWRASARLGFPGPLHWPAPTVAALAGLAAAGGYALFSGWGVPAQRTVWMLAVVTALRLSARHWPAPHVWGLAGAVVVAADPWALLQPGFWLSFVAVGVLMAGTSASRPSLGGGDAPRTRAAPVRTMLVPQGWARHALAQAGAAVLALVREQVLITGALLPLSLLFFGQVSVVGLLANLVAIPWVTLLVTPLALLGMLWAPGWDLAAALLAQLMTGLQWLSVWPWASLSAPMPPWPLAVLALLGAALVVLRLPLAWRLWVLPLWLPVLLWQPPRPAPGQFELLAADVGQGTAVLVRTAGHSLLYDAGPRYSPESDAGHRVLLPLLAQSGERLDALMLSHRDSDHTGGAAAVLAMQPQAQLRSSLEAEHPLVAAHPDHLPCQAGQRWRWDGVLFEVLHPRAEATDRAEAPDRPNARSCVLRIEAEGAAALLTGDIEAAQEHALLARGLAPVDLLLVPHHGSKTSSSTAFLDALQPRLALVQAGYRNRFGHPAPGVIERYQARGIEVYTSARCGAATWRSGQPRQVHCERVHRRRYWHHRMPP